MKDIKVKDKRNVFIDTSIYEEQSFNYNSRLLLVLSSMVETNRLSIYITDITIREVEDRIEKGIKNEYGRYKKLTRQFRITRNTRLEPYSSFLREFESCKIRNDLTEQFHEFIKKLDIEILKVDFDCFGKILKDYFDGKAPFGDNRKQEFIDALSMETVNEWAIQNKTKIYVLSKDHDIKEICNEKKDTLIYFDRLEEFIDNLNSEDSEIAKYVHDLIGENLLRFTNPIEKEFVNLGFYLIDRDGDVLEVKVSTVQVDEPLIISIENEKATFTLESDIEYEAYIEYKDLDTALYDDEEKIPIIWEMIKTTIIREVRVEVEFLIEFYRHDERKFKIIKTNILTDSIDINEYDPMEYK